MQMISFMRAYSEGHPVAMTSELAGTRLVVGFVETPKYVSFMTDGFLNPAVGVRPSDHLLIGPSKVNNDLSLSVDGARFFPITHGHALIGAYNRHFVKDGLPTDIVARSAYDRAEYALRMILMEIALVEANRERARGAD